MISHQYRCIFIEVPKTGSTSVRKLIGQPPKPHLDISQVRRQLPQEFVDEASRSGLRNWMARRRKAARCFRTYFKFGFVRNPWDRTVSLYNRREGIQQAGKMSFGEFVEWIRYSSDTSIHPRRHRNQLDWFTDGFGRVLVDFIGRFEQTDADWVHIQRRLGIEQPLPHENSNPSNSRHYTEYYTPRTREIIARKFRKDIEYFGYEFDVRDTGAVRRAA